MNAGIPGVGISGLFYVISALWMPVRELAAGVRGGSTPSSRAMVLRQCALAAGILLAMGGTAYLIGLGMARAFPQAPISTPTTAALIAGPLSLIAVYMTVHLVRIILGMRQRR